MPLVCLMLFVGMISRAEESSIDDQRNACENNMRWIDVAKDQWAIENGKTNGTTVNINDLVNGKYLPEKVLKCPSGGQYKYNVIGENCRCSIHGTVPKSGNENIAATAANDGNFWKIFNEWESLMEGKNGMPKDAAKAGQILTQLIKGVYLVKFGPADGFNPQTPGEFLQAFHKTSSLRSGKERLGGSGFFRTKRENNKLTASFLTEQPDQMKQDIEENPQLVFISMEEVTREKFISHVKSVQESLQNEVVMKFGSPAVANTVQKSGDKAISSLCRIIPSTLDPAYAAKREQAFTEWNKPPRTDEIFKELSKSNIPIYNEHKADQNNRDIYMLNTMGARYWVLGGLTEQALLKVHEDKLKIGDELVSASYYKNGQEQKVYWALWCSGTHAYLVKQKMREYGITPSRIELTFAYKLQMFSGKLDPYAGILALSSLGISLITLLLLVILFIKSMLTRRLDKE